jgi:uncharacterized membrane protein HdeD (DUF308 family)
VCCFLYCQPCNQHCAFVHTAQPHHCALVKPACSLLTPVLALLYCPRPRPSINQSCICSDSLSTSSGGLIPEAWATYLFLGLMALLVGVLAVLIQRPVIIIATSISGAYLLLAGVDAFVYLFSDHLGGGSFWLIVPYLMQGNIDNLEADWVTWLFCARSYPSLSRSISVSLSLGLCLYISRSVSSRSLDYISIDLCLFSVSISVCLLSPCVSYLRVSLSLSLSLSLSRIL